VVLVERAELGGTCLNWGCIPTKSLLATADLLRRIRRAGELGLRVGEVEVDFPRMMERKEEVVVAMRGGVEAACKRRKVRVVRGQGVLEDGAVRVGEERLEYDHLIVCVGTEPSGLPGIDMGHPRVVTSNGVLRLPTLLVIGGGVIGCEFASLFAPLGVAVSVVEVLPQILAGVEPRVVRDFRRLVEREGITFHAGRRVEKVDYRDDQVTATLDDGTAVEADLVLVSVGRAAQTAGIGLEGAGVELTSRGHIVVDEMLRTANPRIWAAGDCIGGLQLAHLGSAEGARAVENALGVGVRPMDRTVVPSCIYTHPEIAMVGLGQEAAKAAGHEVKVGQARFLGNGKAVGENEPDGLVQLVSDASSGEILGATVMGVHAVEIIHEVGVAISGGLTVDELGDIIHAHPTVSELVMEAAEQAEGLAPYLS
jgi:dihydrolipoamide dehydrogenase